MTPDPSAEQAARRFRKKPVVIEAMQFSGHMEDWQRIYDFCRDAMGLSRLTGPHPRPEDDGLYRASIETLEGALFVEPLDWIIRGVKGEFYPCKPEIFAETYEAIP